MIAYVVSSKPESVFNGYVNFSNLPGYVYSKLEKAFANLCNDSTIYEIEFTEPQEILDVIADLGNGGCYEDAYFTIRVCAKIKREVLTKEKK